MQQHEEVELSALGMGKLPYILFVVWHAGAVLLKWASFCSGIEHSLCPFLRLIVTAYDQELSRDCSTEGHLFAYLVRLDAFIKLSSDNLPLNLVYYLAAIATVVTVAEILKNNGLAVEKSMFSISLPLSNISASFGDWRSAGNSLHRGAGWNEVLKLVIWCVVSVGSLFF